MPRAKKTTGDGQKPAKTTRKQRKATNTSTDTPKKRGGGREPAYEALEVSKKLESIRGWAIQGATMEEIAAMIGVHVSTLYTWQDKKHRQYHKEFVEAVRAGRYIASGELVASAFKQSTGYTIPALVPVKVKRWELFKDEHGRVVYDNYGKPVRVQNEYVELVETQQAVPANAQITQFMLKNWLPDQYKDKQEIESYGKEAPTFVDDLTGGDDV